MKCRKPLQGLGPWGDHEDFSPRPTSPPRLPPLPPGSSGLSLPPEDAKLTGVLTVERVPQEQAEAQAVAEVESLVADALIKEKQGDLRGAFLDGQTLLFDYQDSLSPLQLFGAYLLMGRVSIEGGKRERALKYLQKAHQLNPDNSEVIRLIERARTSEGTKSETAPMSVPPDVVSLFLRAQVVHKEVEPLPSAPLASGPSEFLVDLPWGAGFFRRLAAFGLDGLVVCLLVAMMVGLSSTAMGQGFKKGFAFFFGAPGPAIAFGLVLVLLFLVYLILFTYFGGQTLGKMLFRLQVVQVDGRRLTLLRSILRTLGIILAALPGLAGLLWALFDRNRRGWHDRLGRSLVIQLRSPEPQNSAASLSTEGGNE